MTNYSFYTGEYAGSVIPESTFREYIQRASDWLQWLEGCCTVVPYGPQSRKMALCALAETYYNYRKRHICQQVQAGSMSVRYEKDAVPLQRQLLESVQGYLEVYRGVG